MLSNLFKILYTLTYINHFFLIIFLYQLYEAFKANDWKTNNGFTEWTLFIINIVWPIVVFLLLIFLCGFIIRTSKDLPRTTAIFKNGNQQDIVSPIMASQFLPYISFVLKLVKRQETFAMVSLIILIPMSFLLLMNRGCYNVSLAILGYKQYRVNSETNSYLLISKRRINNFNHTFNLVELNNEILLEI